MVSFTTASKWFNIDDNFDAFARHTIACMCDAKMGKGRGEGWESPYDLGRTSLKSNSLMRVLKLFLSNVLDTACI